MTETEKRVPELRFEGFIDDWEQRKLGDSADIKDSARISNELWVENGIPYLRSSDLVNGELNGELFISKETYEGYASKTGAPQKNDVLFTSGGKVGIVYHKKDESPVYVQGGAVLYVKTSTSNLLDGSFLSIYFSSPRMQIYMDIASSGGTIKHFTLKPANASPIIFPSLSEQQQVGSFFKQLDDTIALHQRKLNLLKLLKQTYLNTLFAQNGENSPALRFAGFSESWEQRKLGDIVDVLDGDRGKNYPSVNEFYENEHTLFLNASNVTKNGFSFQNNQFISEQKSNSLGNGKVQVDDIVLTSRGSLGHIAWYNNAVHKNIPNARINSGMLLLRSTSKTTPSYIMQYLKSPLGKKQIDFLSFGSAQPQLTKKDVVDYRIKIPSNIEQETIGRFFSSFDNAIVLHQFKFEKLLELKNVLLGKMFL